MPFGNSIAMRLARGLVDCFIFCSFLFKKIHEQLNAPTGDLASWLPAPGIPASPLITFRWFFQFFFPFLPYEKLPRTYEKIISCPDCLASSGRLWSGEAG